MNKQWADAYKCVFVCTWEYLHRVLIFKLDGWHGKVSLLTPTRIQMCCVQHCMMVISHLSCSVLQLFFVFHCLYNEHTVFSFFFLLLSLYFSIGVRNNGLGWPVAQWVVYMGMIYKSCNAHRDAALNLVCPSVKRKVSKLKWQKKRL